MKGAARALLLLVVLSGLIGSDAPAWAGGTHGDLDLGNDKVEARLTNPPPKAQKQQQEADTQSTSGGGSSPPCQWYAYQGEDPPPRPKDAPKGGRWYVRYCENPQFGSLQDFLSTVNGWDFLNQGRVAQFLNTGYELSYAVAPPSEPTPEERLRQVVASLPLPDGELRVNPPDPDMQLVTVPIWVWLESPDGGVDPAAYVKRSKTLTLNGYTLTFSVEPTLSIDTGADPAVASTSECTAPGIAWTQTAERSQACTVTYHRAGTYQLTATVSWTVHWQVNGEPRDPVQGPTRTDSVTLQVREAQTVVTDVS